MLLHFDQFERSILLFKFQDLSDEVISVSAIHFGVGNVDHVLIDEEINLQKEDVKKAS